MRAALLTLSGALDRLCRDGAMLATVLMVVLIAVQVLARYLFSEPPAWTEEGARYAMVWAGLLGATVAFRGGFDPVLTHAERFRTGALRIVGLVLRAAAVVLFLGPVWYYSIFGPNLDPARGYLARSAARTAESLGVSMAWFTIALPIAITIIFVHVLAQIATAGAAPVVADDAQREIT
jgi:TRAP-type C4-dicarboxylate transport system permease small subunit